MSDTPFRDHPDTAWSVNGARRHFERTAENLDSLGCSRHTRITALTSLLVEHLDEEYTTEQAQAFLASLAGEFPGIIERSKVIISQPPERSC